MSDSPDLRVLGILSANGNPTGDKRTIAALRWSLPLPLRRAREDFGGHNGAVVVGAIEDIKQAPTGELMFVGKIFDTPDGRAAYDEMYARYASSGLKYGVSVDLDDVIVEEDPDDPEMAVVTSGRLRGATLCDIPAYSTAYAVLASQLQTLVASAGFLEISADLFDMVRAAGFIEAVDVRPEDGVVLYDFTPPSLIAAGAPRVGLPASWFDNPRLQGETAMTVTEDGRIFGHCATWKTCHTGFGNVCITPPRSATNYAYFRTGVIEADGVQIPVGHITMGAGHADTRLAAGPAAEHYDNVTSIVADVVAGEDEFGIWLSGAIREGVTPEQVRELMATAPSGDWRVINGNLEMVAVLNVVSPGFPVPRMRAMVASGGEVTSLVASACFETEANVDENVETPAEETPVVEIEPSVDPAEVAPEVVAAEMGAPLEVEPEEDDSEDEDKPDETEESAVAPEITLADVVARISDLNAMIAKLQKPEETEESPAEEDAEPVEAVPGVEHSHQDVLAALDALVNGPTQSLDVGKILAELDAKVG